MSKKETRNGDEHCRGIMSEVTLPGIVVSALVTGCFRRFVAMALVLVLILVCLSDNILVWSRLQFPSLP